MTPPPPFDLLSSVCWSIILLPKNNVTLLHLNIKTISQATSALDWKNVVFILGTVSSAII